MIRLALLVMILAALPARAGFRMYGPGGQYMNSTGGSQPAQSEIQLSPSATYQSSLSATPIIKNDPADNVDMSGVEWRQSRGYYSGRAAKEMTKKFGYRAGKYRLEYRYKAGRHFAIWMYSRRGLSELLVNRIGRADTEVDVILTNDDEIWFEVHSPFGNWEFTFERIR